MLKFSDIGIDDISPGGFDHGEHIDNRVHCKIMPCLIFAQSYVGSYEITCNGEHIELNSGEAFFTPPDTFMRIVHHVDPESRRMRARWLHFNVSILGVNIASLYDFPLRVKSDISEKIAPDIERLRELREAGDVVTAMEVNELCYRVMQRLIKVAKPKPNLQELLHSSERVQAAADFVRRNINRRIAVAELARACSISPPALFRYFSDTLKTTPQKFIMKLKMEHAATLLRASEISLAEIAEATGFANQFHFSRCFKQCYGTAPSSYRNSGVWDFSSY